MSTVVKLVSLIFISASIYTFSLNGDFVFDDSEAIVKNADVKFDTPLSTVFQNDFWGTHMTSNASHKSYRPLTILSFRLNRWFSGDKLQPLHFKIINLALHVIVTVIIYRLLCNIFNKYEKSSKNIKNDIWTDGAYLSAVLFSVHPIHVEAVSGIVGRADILAALFFFLCILFYDKSIARSKTAASVDVHLFKNSFKRWMFFAASLLCAAISLLCKETGITSLIFCSIYDIVIIHKINLVNLFGRYEKFKTSKEEKIEDCSNSKQITAGSSERILDLLKSHRDLVTRQIIVCCFLLYMVYCRLMVMDFKGPTFQISDNPAAFSSSFATRVATYNYLYFINLLLLIWPQWLCFDWSMGCIPLLKSPLDPRVVFAMLFWCFVCGIVFRICSSKTRIRQRKLYIISFSIMALPFLPASNILMPVGFVVAERILYTSSLGFCITIVIGFQNLLSRYKERLLQKLLKSSFVFLLIILALRSIDRSFQWQTEQELFESAIGVCPLNAKVHYNIGKNARDRSDITLAEEEYRIAIDQNPKYYQAMNNLANLLKDLARYDEAESLLTEALKIKEDFPAAWMNLGIVLTNLKQPIAAEHAYMQALRYRKNYADCYYNLGNLYLEQGKHDAALYTWSKATSIDPKHVVAWSNSLALLDNSGQIDRGLRLAPMALQALPEAPSVHFNVANLFGKKGQFVPAEEHFLRAIELKGRNSQAIYFANLGVLYHRWKKPDRAIEMYKKALIVDPSLDSARDNLRKLAKYNHHVSR